MKPLYLLAILSLNTLKVFSQDVRVEAFTWHSDKDPIALYGDASRTEKRIDIYPNIHEGMAGCIVYIDGELDSCLRVSIEPAGYFFVEKGALAVNTRNYDNDPFVLYEYPDRKASVIVQIRAQQTVRIFGMKNGWLFVEARTDCGSCIRGWLPPELQCGNPYTTCN